MVQMDPFFKARPTDVMHHSVLYPTKCRAGSLTEMLGGPIIAREIFINAALE